MLPKAAIVCALLALFSVGSQGNKEDNQYLAAWNERVLRFGGQRGVFRRESETCLPDSDEYYRRQDLLSCDGEYIRAVFNEIETSNCRNNLYNDATFFSACGTNHNGEVCGGIKDSKYNDFYGQCDTSLHTNNTNNCSSGCQTALRQLSNSVGCCIHENYEASMSSLWMNCDIEQPEVCADIPNTVEALAKRNVDPCSEKFGLRQGFFKLCTYLGEKLEKLDRECGVEEVSPCGFDKGEFCTTMDDPTSHFEMISDECYSDSEEGNARDDVCSTNCRNALKEYIDTVGCCFHYFNSSFYSSEVGSTSAYNELTSGLFSACGVEVPNACRSFNSTAVPAVLRSGVYSIGLIIISLIAIYIHV